MTKITVIPAKEAKNRFGEMLDAVQRRPIMITKNGRPVAKLVAYVDPGRFEEVEDEIWLEKVRKIEKGAKFLGTKQSMKFLKSL